MKALDVLVDLDGVCYDFTQGLRYYRAHKGHAKWSDMPEAQTWTFFTDQWGMTLQQFVDTCLAATDQGYLFWHGAPITGTQFALNWLRDQGHRIHIVTDRETLGGPKARRATETWLYEHELPFDTLTLSADKTVIPGIDISIDDRPSNYNALDAAGMYPWLRDQPHNRTHEGRRVQGWAEFIDVVDQLAKEEAA